jgi:secreted trypsin-like serine protease
MRCSFIQSYRHYFTSFGDKIMRRSITVGAAAAAVAAALAQPAVSAEPVRNAINALRPSMNLRVIGGLQSVDGAWPWQVLVVIFVRTSEGKTATMMCGGSVIAARWVLTAAHCVPNVDPQARTIVVAEQQVSGAARAMVMTRGLRATQNSPLTDVDDQALHRNVTPIVHSGYRPQSETHENDIALLRLNEDVRSTAVAPLLRADTALESPPVKAIVTGWGRMRELDADGNDPATGQKLDPKEVDPEHLMEVKLPLVSTGACKEAYKASSGVIDGRTLCAADEEGGKDSCQGDSGGPLVTQDSGGRWMQIGVVSWGNGCGRKGFPGIYTRVSAFAGWLRQNVGSDLGGDGPQAQQQEQQQQQQQPQQQQQQQPQQQDLTVNPRLDNPAGLTIAFDKGEVVSIGDRVSYRVTTNQPGYLAIFDLAPDGTLTQIFPNERALNSPTGRSQEALRLRPDRPRLIPDQRNPYAAFEVVITEPRGKGVMVAVLSEQPLAGLEVPALTKTFATSRQAVAALGRMRNGLREMRGLTPAPEEGDIQPSVPGDGGGSQAPRVPQANPGNTTAAPQGDPDANRPKWSIAVHEYQVK